jgi:hypothetical protein
MPRKNSKTWSFEEDCVLKDLYGTMSYKDMVPIFNVPRTNIARRAQTLGISGKDPHIKSLVKRKYDLNEEFFKYQTPLSCYWAGFISADGCLCKKDSGVIMALSRKDRDHLKLFLKDICSNSPIFDFETNSSKNKEGKYAASKVTIYSKKFRKDLELNFNLTPKKSLTYVPPKFLNEKCELAFFKGIIDGDGTTSENKNVVTLGLIGSSFVIDWAENLMEEIEPKLPHHKRGRYYYPEKSEAQTIKCSGTRAHKILSKVRCSVDRELSRKWDFLDTFIKTTRPYNRVGMGTDTAIIIDQPSTYE